MAGQCARITESTRYLAGPVAMTNLTPTDRIVQGGPRPANRRTAERGATRRGHPRSSFRGMVYLPLIFAVIGGDDAGVASMIGVVLVLTGFGVWAWLTIGYMKSNGQSIAKKMLAIKVVRAMAHPLRSAGSWLRNVLNWLISIIPLSPHRFAVHLGETRQCRTQDADTRRQGLGTSASRGSSTPGVPNARGIRSSFVPQV